MPLFQLLPIIGLVAPPLSKSHLVLACDLVMVSYMYEQLVKMQVYVHRLLHVFIMERCVG